MANQMNIAALHGPPQPMFNPRMDFEEFLDDYERWCTSCAFTDDDVIASKFQFSFGPSVRRAIKNAYDGSATWAQMKAKCIPLVNSLFGLDDFNDAKERWEHEDTIMRYDETVGMYQIRFEALLVAYQRARQREQLPALTDKEKVDALVRRLYRSLQTKVISKRHRVTTLSNAWAVCKEQEQTARELLRQQRMRASYSSDPSLARLQHIDSFGATVTPPGANGTGRDASAPPAMMPARATLHGDPSSQYQTTTTVMRKRWEAPVEAREKEIRDKIMAEMKERDEALFQRLKSLIPSAGGGAAREEKAASAAVKPSGASRFQRLARCELPFREADLPEDRKACVSLVPGPQWCLWCATDDHNCATCTNHCPRCGGRHGLEDCGVGWKDVRCSHCDARGHDVSSCIWRILGDFSSARRKRNQSRDQDRERDRENTRGGNSYSGKRKYGDRSPRGGRNEDNGHETKRFRPDVFNKRLKSCVASAVSQHTNKIMQAIRNERERDQRRRVRWDDRRGRGRDRDQGRSRDRDRGRDRAQAKPRNNAQGGG